MHFCLAGQSPCSRPQRPKLISDGCFSSKTMKWARLFSAKCISCSAFRQWTGDSGISRTSGAGPKLRRVLLSPQPPWPIWWRLPQMPSLHPRFFSYPFPSTRSCVTLGVHWVETWPPPALLLPGWWPGPEVASRAPRWAALPSWAESRGALLFIVLPLTGTGNGNKRRAAHYLMLSKYIQRRGQMCNATTGIPVAVVNHRSELVAWLGA